MWIVRSPSHRVHLSERSTSAGISTLHCENHAKDRRRELNPVSATLLSLLFFVFVDVWLYSSQDPVGGFLARWPRIIVLASCFIALALTVLRRGIPRSELPVFAFSFLTFSPLFIVELMERVHESPYDVPTDPTILANLAMLPMWVLIGATVTSSRGSAAVIWSALAKALAVVSVVAFGFHALSVRGLPLKMPDNGSPLVASQYLGYCVMVPLFWYLERLISGVANKARQGICIGLLASSLYTLVVFRKGVWISAILGGASLLLLASISFRFASLRSRRWLVSTASIIVGLAAVMLMAGSSVREELTGRVHRVFNATETQPHTVWEGLATGRFDFWTELYGRFQYSPWVGSGFGQTVAVPGTLGRVSSHSEFMNVLVSVGVLGAIPLALALSYVVWRAARLLRERQPGALAFVATLVSFLVAASGATLAPNVPGYLFLISFLVGVMLKCSFCPKEERQLGVT